MRAFYEIHSPLQKVVVFPPREEIFSAFNLTPLTRIRVVVIGQDPYHGIGQVCSAFVIFFIEIRFAVFTILARELHGTPEWHKRRVR